MEPPAVLVTNSTCKMKKQAQDAQNPWGLTQRSITALILVILIAGAVCAGRYGFYSLVMIIDLLTLFEFYRLFQSDALHPRIAEGCLLSASLLVTVIAMIEGGNRLLLLINLPVAFMIFVLELFRNARFPFLNLAITFFGILYISVPLCFFIWVPFLSSTLTRYQYQLVLGFFIMLWASDTGAYFVGKLTGRHHLFKRLSPNKTWEGAVGGLLAAVIAAFSNAIWLSVIDWWCWITMALIIVVTGITGDLIKSMLKRSLGLQDSGRILPGHGGMLDRFDSLLGSAPFVASYLLLCCH